VGRLGPLPWGAPGDRTYLLPRRLLRPVTVFFTYNRALDSNLPFPKTRRIVFLNNRPATLPGWAELAVPE
jgi:hypothetical protein